MGVGVVVVVAMVVGTWAVFVATLVTMPMLMVMGMSVFVVMSTNAHRVFSG